MIITKRFLFWIIAIGIIILLFTFGMSCEQEVVDNANSKSAVAMVAPTGSMRICTITYTDGTVEVFENIKGQVWPRDGYIYFAMLDGRDIAISMYNVKKAEEQIVKGR